MTKNEERRLLFQSRGYGEDLDYYTGKLVSGLWKGKQSNDRPQHEFIGSDRAVIGGGPQHRVMQFTKD